MKFFLSAITLSFSFLSTADAYQPKCLKVLDKEMELSLIGGHFQESNSCTIRTSKGSSVRFEPVKTCSGRLGGRGYSFPGWSNYAASKITYNSGLEVEAMTTSFTPTNVDPKASGADAPPNPEIKWFMNDDCTIGKILVGHKELDRADCVKNSKVDPKDREAVSLKEACAHMIKNYADVWKAPTATAQPKLVELPAQK